MCVDTCKADCARNNEDDKYMHQVELIKELNKLAIKRHGHEENYGLVVRKNTEYLKHSDSKSGFVMQTRKCRKATLQQMFA